MASSARQAIACIFLIFAIVTNARSQNGPEKRPGATFTGKITIKGKGAPRIAVGLLLIDDSMHRSTRYRAITDDEGNYRITNVGPGKYRIVVVAPGFIVPASYTDKTFLITKNETVETVDFALMRGGVITGRVTDSSGRPVIEEEISIAPVEPGQQYTGFSQQRRTDDRGIYRIIGVSPGKYRVAAGQPEHDFGARAGGYSQTFHPAEADASKATIIEVTEGGVTANVDITLPDPIVYYSAFGRIIDGDTGQPLANISYGVQKFGDRFTSSLTTSAVSNKDGEFKLENLSQGKYAVFAEVPPDSDYRIDSVQFDVIDQDVTGLIVKTTRGASLSGTLVLEGIDDKTVHEKLREVRVSTYSATDTYTRTSTQSGTVNADGSFRIGGLRAGVVNFGLGMKRLQIVRVERAGAVQPQGVEVKDREQVSGLRLIANYANASIQGVVKLDTGSLPANALAQVSVKRLGELPSPFSNSGGSAQVDAHGQFLIEELLPGTYEVMAVYATDPRSNWRRATQQVVVTSGAVANVTLTIDTTANPGRP